MQSAEEGSSHRGRPRMGEPLFRQFKWGRGYSQRGKPVLVHSAVGWSAMCKRRRETLRKSSVPEKSFFQVGVQYTSMEGGPLWEFPSTKVAGTCPGNLLQRESLVPQQGGVFAGGSPCLQRCAPHQGGSPRIGLLRLREFLPGTAGEMAQMVTRLVATTKFKPYDRTRS